MVRDHGAFDFDFDRRLVVTETAPSCSDDEAGSEPLDRKTFALRPHHLEGRI